VTALFEVYRWTSNLEKPYLSTQNKPVEKALRGITIFILKVPLILYVDREPFF
jgi:hypothetical protein